MNTNEKTNDNKRESADKKEMFASASYKKGAYSAGLTVVVIAIAVVLALLAGLLPEDVKKIDISDDKVYSIGETTETLLASLENDISFTVIAEPEAVDSRIERLIKQYTSRSDKITLVEIDPVRQPAQALALEGEANSIIVKNEDNGKRSTVRFSDILVVDPYSSYYYGTSDPVEFDGEGQLTGALGYVTSESGQRIYLTNGHGESALPDAINERLTKLSLSTDGTSLLMDGGVPDDCTLLIMNGPSTDISADEKTALSEYLHGGGALMYVAGLDPVALPNLHSLLAEYGITMTNSYVGDAERYYQDSAFIFFPVLDDVHEITGGYASDAYLLLIQPAGIELTAPARDTITTASFMTTSEHGVSVTETEQTEGVFVLGATAVESAGGENRQTRIVALSSVSILEEQILSSFPSLVNADVYIDAVTWFMDDVENISIPAKSLALTYNTVSGGAGWRALFVFIIPAAFIAAGLYVWIRRRNA